MFDGAHFLHKGIPTNMFGSTPLPYVTTLIALFRETLIMYDIIDDSNKWTSSTTFAPLINLTSIEEIFSRNKYYNSYTDWGTLKNQVKNGGEDVYVISPNTFTFKTISNIRSAFKYSGLNIPIEFLGFEYGNNAFFDSAINTLSTLFVNNSNISAIRDVSRMFYDITDSPSKTIEGLSTFINNISMYPNIKKTNIAGNLLNEDVSADLKADSAEADNDFYVGFNIGAGRPFYNN